MTFRKNYTIIPYIMQLTCWGARGTFPVSGPRYILFGGNTSCLEVAWDDGTEIIVDAGTGLRTLGQKMIKYKQVNKFSLILTHLHWDHIMGFPFYPPFYHFPVTCSIVGHLGASSRLKRLLSLYSREIYSPLNQTRFKTTLNFEDLPEKEWRYGEHLVRYHQHEHPGGALGLRFMGETADAVFCTDNELGLMAKKKKKYAAMVKFVEGAKILIHDANYT